jgi:hypothetical protein
METEPQNTGKTILLVDDDLISSALSRPFSSIRGMTSWSPAVALRQLKNHTNTKVKFPCFCRISKCLKCQE